MNATWKRRLAWYAGGFLVAAACFALAVGWMGIVSWLLPDVHAFDAQPAPLKFARQVLGYLPWIAAAAAIALRLWRGRSVAVFSCLAGLATPYLVVMSLLLGGPVVEEWWHETSFDAVAWRSHDPMDQKEPFTMWPPRLCMVDDLIASGRLDGLTRGEVVGLLGEPSLPSSDAELHYYLGPERGLLRIDSETLRVDFDARGVVARYQIYRD